MPVFPRLRNLRELKRKLKAGEPVKIGVFCSGNRDRSAFAEHVLRKALHEAGHTNVEVFSFGVNAAKKAGEDVPRSSERTQKIAREKGYDMSQHVARHMREKQKEIGEADLLLGMSPWHVGMAAEYFRERSKPQLYKHILVHAWTLKGLAERKEWTKGPRLLVGQATGLALDDPHEWPDTKEGYNLAKKDLEIVEKAAQMAARRLISRR